MDRFQVTSRLTEFWVDAGKSATVTNIGSSTVFGSPDTPPTSTGTAAWSLAPGASRVEDVGAVWVRTADGTSSTLTVDLIASGLAVDTGTGVPSAVGSGGSGGGIVAPTDVAYDVFLIAGQSNAVGYTVAADYRLYDPYDKDVWQYGTTGLRIASDPLAHPDNVGGVGPGMSFARWWAQTHPGRRVLLIPFAVGGTGFASAAPNTWLPTAGPTSLYARAIAAANTAIAEVKKEAPAATIAGFLWVQGENDAWSNWTQSQYATQLDALIDGFRANVNGAGPTTPFIIGRMVPEWIGSTGSGTSVQIDQAHADTPRRKAYTWVASGSVGTSGGSDGASLFHYTAAGARKNGDRMYFSLTRAALNTGSTPLTPDPPSYPHAVVNGSEVDLSWLPAVSNSAITGYEVWKSTASGGETLLATLGNVLTYTDTALTNGTTYFYKVKAINTAGTSGFSTETSIEYTLQTLIAADTFTRADTSPADNSAALGTTEVGGLTWTYRAGYKIAISGDKALLIAATGTAQSCVTVAVGTANVDVRAKLLPSSPAAETPGVTVRYTDESNYVVFRMYDGYYEAVKVVGGVESLMAGPGDNGRINVVPAIGDVVRLIAKGTVYTCFVNGTQVAQITDSGPSTTAQNVGLRGKAGGFTCFLDDFECYTAP